MIIGAMNHPARDVLQEMRWMSELGLGFIDLTLEPPAASVDMVNVPAIRQALKDYGLGVVGHTAYYLPIAGPFESIRKAAVQELIKCLHVFAELGAKWMNIHPGRKPPMHSWAFTVERNLQSLSEVLDVARSCGIGLMIENLPGEFNTVPELAELLDPLPELGLHLDIGHTNLMVQENSTPQIIATYGHRIAHVHVHDNKGGRDDLHLPLGTGNIDFVQYVRLLRATGYDATVTLEVFTQDDQYLKLSRAIFRKLWDNSG